jgi:SET domain-containing protein
MVIEYVGELVRPAVADVREVRLYDAAVGAGTYVFRMGADTCVDATRAGNLAHLLNHSCEPNCYSRTITLAADGARTDHVVIFAARALRVGEELTYDYRFCGAEALPCSCSAAACRGTVNEQLGGGGGGELWVPRAAVQPYLP